jgi:tetratricopeptide (TPR) repeat protein
MLPIARAALEQMAGAGTLDTEALADLAEVRWRSGDLEGAAEAARAHQAFGGREFLADLILAESHLQHARVNEARPHAEAVERRVDGALAIPLAGERQADAWGPLDSGWMDAGAGRAGRFGLLAGGSEVADPSPSTWPPAPGPPRPPGTDVQAAAEPPAHRPQAPRGPGAPALDGRIAGGQLEAAEALFAEGRLKEGAERLTVLLRVDAALAPVILSLADRALVAGAAAAEGVAALHVLRGDAYRAMGREIEAETAYQEALRALPARPDA